jgi:hypothetical protein
MVGEAALGLAVAVERLVGKGPTTNWRRMASKIWLLS